MTHTPFFESLKKNPMIKNLGAIAFLALLIVGVVVAGLAANRSQEIRQQASVDSTITTLSFSEQKKDFLYTELVKIPLIAQIPQGKNLAGIQAWADISGQFPDANFEFKPATIGGFDDPILKLENTSSDANHNYTLSLAYLAKGGQPFVTDGQPLTLGNLEFPPASPGTVNITFDPQRTKIEEVDSTENLVKSFATQTFNLLYTSNSPTPTPLTAKLSCNQTCQTDNDCGSGFCYQPPMPTCPPGLGCAQVMPAKVCRNQTNPTSVTCEGLANTPIPSGSANVCTSLSFQTPDQSEQVRVGHNLSFTCGQIGSLEYYQFQVIQPNKVVVALPSVSAKSRTSAPFTVQQSGAHLVQCRGCQAQAQDDSNQLTGCMDWEEIITTQ